MKNIAIENDRLDIETSRLETVQNQKEFQLKYIGSLRPCNGHTCFGLNLKTGEVFVAKLEETAINFNDAKIGKISNKSKLVIEPDCIYDTALNKANFIKKMKKKLGIK